MAGPENGDMTEEVAIRRKSAAQKDNNHILRQQQIISYKTAMSKEARAERSRLRQGQFQDSKSGENSGEESVLTSPKKRKKVDFNLQTEDTVILPDLPKSSVRKTRSMK